MRVLLKCSELPKCGYLKLAISFVEFGLESVAVVFYLFVFFLFSRFFEWKFKTTKNPKDKWCLKLSNDSIHSFISMSALRERASVRARQSCQQSIYGNSLRSAFFSFFRARRQTWSTHKTGHFTRRNSKPHANWNRHVCYYGVFSSSKKKSLFFYISSNERWNDQCIKMSCGISCWQMKSLLKLTKEEKTVHQDWQHMCVCDVPWSPNAVSWQTNRLSFVCFYFGLSLAIRKWYPNTHALPVELWMNECFIYRVFFYCCCLRLREYKRWNCLWLVPVVVVVEECVSMEAHARQTHYLISQVINWRWKNLNWLWRNEWDAEKEFQMQMRHNEHQFFLYIHVHFDTLKYFMLIANEAV